MPPDRSLSFNMLLRIAHCSVKSLAKLSHFVRLVAHGVNSDFDGVKALLCVGHGRGNMFTAMLRSGLNQFKQTDAGVSEPGDLGIGPRKGGPALINTAAQLLNAVSQALFGVLGMRDNFAQSHFERTDLAHQGIAMLCDGPHLILLAGMARRNCLVELSQSLGKSIQRSIFITFQAIGEGSALRHEQVNLAVKRGKTIRFAF
jgi:hypothetical protein